jgi:hypothetical protein
MLKGGLGVPHAFLPIEPFSPKELVEIPGVGLETTRLVFF